MHQLGGFDRAAAHTLLGSPASLTPLVVIAIGKRDPAAVLAEPFAARETAPRERRPVESLLAPLVGAAEPVAA